MELNDWITRFDLRIQQLTEILDKHRSSCPLAVAQLEQLLQDVKRIRDENLPPQE